MQSRYDYMMDSVVLDNDGICYPDPLLDFNNGKLSRIPTAYTITAGDLQKFWTCMWEQYGRNDLDDLWLSLQGTPYLMDLRPGDQIYKVAAEDLTSYLTTKQLGTD